MAEPTVPPAATAHPTHAAGRALEPPPELLSVPQAPLPKAATSSMCSMRHPQDAPLCSPQTPLALVPQIHWDVPAPPLVPAAHNRREPQEPAVNDIFFIKYTSSLGTNLQIYKHRITKCLHCNKIELQIQEKAVKNRPTRSHTRRDGDERQSNSVCADICIDHTVSSTGKPASHGENGRNQPLQEEIKAVL